MPRFEYNCVEMVMDKSKDSDGYERYLNTSGAVGWRLIDTFQTTTALGSPIRMLTFIREVTEPTPAEARAIKEIDDYLEERAKSLDPYFPAKVLFGISILCLTLYGLFSFIMRH